MGLCRQASNIFVCAQCHVGGQATNLHDIDALNRYQYRASGAPPCSLPNSDNQGNTLLTADTQIQDELNTIKLMMYIFPRQFELHNVFISEVDRQRTAQKFQDYTLREEEIAQVVGKASSETRLPKLPKRLRGGARRLVQRLQTRHGRCSYIELLRHYCPVPTDSQSRDSISFDANALSAIRSYRSKPGPSQVIRHSRRAGRKPIAQLQDVPKPSFTSLEELACPVAHVSAFCQAVLSKIIPDGFWGEGEVLGHNKRVFLKKVDHFIKLRRFETMTLHEAVQGLKVSACSCLC
jgi:telomerase reverse transcriptase